MQIANKMSFRFSFPYTFFMPVRYFFFFWNSLILFELFVVLFHLGDFFFSSFSIYSFAICQSPSYVLAFIIFHNNCCERCRNKATLFIHFYSILLYLSHSDTIMHRDRNNSTSKREEKTVSIEKNEWFSKQKWASWNAFEAFFYRS